jgi:hypothetical protein
MRNPSPMQTYIPIKPPKPEREEIEELMEHHTPSILNTFCFCFYPEYQYKK